MTGLARDEQAKKTSAPTKEKRADRAAVSGLGYWLWRIFVACKERDDGYREQVILCHCSSAEKK